MKNLSLTAGASLTLIALATLGAQAQTGILSPGAGLTLAYNNDNFTNGLPNSIIGAALNQGSTAPVGQDAAGAENTALGLETFLSTTGPNDLSSIYNFYNLSSSVDGFTGLNPGQTIQFGLHAYGFNATNANGTVTVNVGMYKYAGSLAASLAGTNLFGNAVAVTFNDTADLLDHTYFSNAFTLTGNTSVLPGQYVFAYTSASDFALLDQLSNVYVNRTQNIPTADRTFDKTVYIQDGTNPATQLPTTQNPIGFEIYASPAVGPPVVPETGTFALLALGVLPMGLLAARRRRSA